ncbi:helix-turn-helix transcriptional regulator [Blastococcus tunisiensis]|uniref:WYL domain-containing protein n=1 Tax=Blastococcus tunisiensis TaxID=1798228 RepID=A0A1I2A147_9ACTN|nr:WYL domain-containing protein [Blastococcus sp. DSM 46838]SFE37695.1 WYL domain-containing protein [Blastococcus sp. DSM 46838]
MNHSESRPAASLPPVSLGPEEAAAVAVALASRPDGPYADAGRGALEKVLAVLEPDPRRRAELLATSLWVSAEAGRSAEIRAVVEHAVTRRLVVSLRYHDGKGRPSRRQVEPQLLVRSSDQSFLVAWCRERDALRWFRLDRIEAADLTGETAPRRDLTGLGAPPAGAGPAARPAGASPASARERHPAGRARRPAGEPEGPPRLVVLRGGRG